jgi:hypothetical protein
MNIYKNDGRARRKNKCRRNRRRRGSDAEEASDNATTNESASPEQTRPLKRMLEFDLSSMEGGEYSPPKEELRLGFTDEEIEKVLTIEAFDRAF